MGLKPNPHGVSGWSRKREGRSGGVGWREFEEDFVATDLDFRAGIGGCLFEGVLELVFHVGAVFEATEQTLTLDLVDPEGEFQSSAFTHDPGAVVELGGHLFDEGTDVVHADAGFVGKVSGEFFVRGRIDVT